MSASNTIADQSAALESTESTLHIKSLEEGKYVIVYPDHQLTRIEAIAGKRTDTSLILTPERLVTPTHPSPIFNVTDCRIEQDKNSVFRAKLVGDPAKVRAHFFLGHFFDRSNYRSFVTGSKNRYANS